jgi:CRISPR/Cas system-associated exonuclease Cas4 (RecB family)
MLDHDYCSPSQIDLRYHCPGSVRLQQNQISTGQLVESESASEGTLKHAQANKWRSKPGIPAEVSDDVLWVIERANEILGPYITVADTIILEEYQIDLSDLGISGGKEGCRIDLALVVPGRKAIIIDYKFGVTWVLRPKYNWQMKAYAVGVYRAFGVSEIEAIILQPNTDEEYRVKIDTFYPPEISHFETQIKEIVEKTKLPDAPLVRGDHCTYGYCKVRDICPLWRDAYLSLPVHTTLAVHLKNISPEMRAKLYEDVTAAEAWCKKARHIIEGLAIEGEIDVHGYEIGTGRKTREWGKSNEEIESALVGLMQTLGKKTDIFTLKSPAEIESGLGKSKAVKEAINPLVLYKEGKPTLKKKGFET